MRHGTVKVVWFLMMIITGVCHATTYCGCYTYPGNPSHAYLCLNNNEDCSNLSGMCMVLPSVQCEPKKISGAIVLK